MVVFEGGRRCPAMVFNEKVLCGLGAELGRTGRLSPTGADRALRALSRFVALAPGLRLRALAGVATAAVREAEDGKAFSERVARETNIRLEIASGTDEARLAAQGVLFGEPMAEGLVVDLGGASMELCPVRPGVTGDGISTPLGPQRLGDISNRKRVRRQIADVLAPLVSRYSGDGHRLYLVGGAWRAFGRVQIRHAGHPFEILHEYGFTSEQARLTIAEILATEPGVLVAIPGVSSSRAPTLPHAALLLEGLIERFEPNEIVLSGFGLREGLCYDNLPAAVRRQDPLLSTAAGHERTRARGPGFGEDLSDWLIPAFVPRDIAEERLIRAACYLADVSWRAHPDYRSTACREVVTRVNLSSAGHHGRAFILAALLSRYKGGRRAVAEEPAMALLDSATLERARQVGTLMRLGCTISGAVPGYLTHCPLKLNDGVLTLAPTPSAEVFMGEEVERRLGQAARALGAESQIDS